MDKLDLVISKIDDQKEHVQDRLDSIDRNLAEHMRRTDILEQLHRDNEKRILTLEEIPSTFKTVKSMILYVAAIAGGILTIIKFFEVI